MPPRPGAGAAKNDRLDDLGSNDASIATFKVVKTFDSPGDREAYRDVALRDGANGGTDAMMDQASRPRCVAAARLTPPAGTPVP